MEEDVKVEKEENLEWDFHFSVSFHLGIGDCGRFKF